MLARGGAAAALRIARAPPHRAPRRLSSRRPRAQEKMDIEDVGAAGTRDRVGFKRAEMFSEALAGTVKPYDCHAFLCQGSATEWAHATDAVPGPHAALAEALKSPEVKAAVGGVKTTLFEAAAGSDDAPGDILLFPQMLRYRPAAGAAEEAAGWAPFVREVLLRPGGATATAPGCAPLAGAHVFVCAHARRDKRCGVCGPALVAALREAAAAAAAPVAVHACSHVGGHAYAGNVLIFDRAAGVPRGNWLGYVTPDDVPSLLHDVIGRGAAPPPRLWRGAMGMSVDACKAAAQEMFAACGGSAGCGGCDKA